VEALDVGVKSGDGLSERELVGRPQRHVCTHMIIRITHAGGQTATGTRRPSRGDVDPGGVGELEFS
jgi:hypothetical protein